MLVKEIQNPSATPFLDWIKSGIKTYEGRLADKIKDWNLHIGQQLKLYDKVNPNSWVIVKVTSLLMYNTFKDAYNDLGDRLIPNSNVSDVVDLYNSLFRYDDEKLVGGITSKKIHDVGVVAIGIEVLEQS